MEVLDLDVVAALAKCSGKDFREAAGLFRGRPWLYLPQGPGGFEGSPAVAGDGLRRLHLWSRRNVGISSRVGEFGRGAGLS